MSRKRNVLPGNERVDERRKELQYFWWVKEKKRRDFDVRHHRRMREVEGDRIVKRGVCDCGHHMAMVIQVKEGDKYVDKTTICPRSYYVLKFIDALDKGTQMEFLKAHPYEDFIKQYAILHTEKCDGNGREREPNSDSPIPLEPDK